tara:strand:+ start:134 stop:1378 length:1245 start_codon:yes stop_codon:yes gene_type:complete
MPKEIKIDDLANPILTEYQKVAKDYGETLKLELNSEAIINQASKNSGLKEFGDEDFISRLDVLMQSVSNDEELAGIGKLGIFNDQVRYLENRLKFEKFKKEFPEYQEETISKPIIIIGLPRSGTTHLLNLIAADSRLKSIPYWQSLRPFKEKLLDLDNERDSRQEEAFKEYKSFLQTMPLLKSMHDMHPNHIHEEIELQAMDFSTYLPEWLAYVPEWRDYYLRHDQINHYQYLKDVLKAMQFIQGPKKWVLKSPQHLEQIDPLLKTFPDATFAITYRDPLSVVLSTATMLSYGDRVRRYKVEPINNFNYWHDRIKTLLCSFTENYELIPMNQKSDIHFHELIKDNLNIVKSIYSKNSFDLDKIANNEIKDYINSNKRGKHGQVIYNLEDFNVDKSEFYQSFKFYFDRFNVLKEV